VVKHTFLRSTLGKSSGKEDPRIKAMSEMMDRIKNGRVELKKIAPREVIFFMPTLKLMHFHGSIFLWYISTVG
jgi:wyosine [tRNA(Phe)-imidazoG37] synthetase (radical SAM superfamily)